MILLPALTILLLAVGALLPWGGGDGARFAATMMPMLAIHYWSARHPALVPALFAFATGLLLDVVSYGPLGFWALIALAALALGRGEAALQFNPGFASRLLSILVALPILAGLAWVVTSLYFNRLVDWQPPAYGAIAAALLYPVLMLLLAPIDSLGSARRGNLFDREA